VTTHPFDTASKQQVLHGWVNRPSTDNRDARKVSVGHCQSIAMKQKIHNTGAYLSGPGPRGNCLFSLSARYDFMTDNKMR
jgi:hypothetical protein